MPSENKRNIATSNVVLPPNVVLSRPTPATFPVVINVDITAGHAALQAQLDAFIANNPNEKIAFINCVSLYHPVYFIAWWNVLLSKI